MDKRKKQVRIESGLWFGLQISCTMGMFLSVHCNGAELWVVLVSGAILAET